MTDDVPGVPGVPRGASSGAGWAPVPDPTKLTTDAVATALTQVRREIAALEDGLRREIDNRTAIVNTRFDANDKATDLRIGVIASTPDVLRGEIKEAIAHLKALHEERFSAIQQQFTERDVRGEQEKKASKEALDAALLAQKESVSQQNDANTTAAAKTELNFTKQNDQTAVLIATLEKSLSDRLTELKERIDRGEGQGQGESAATIEARAVAAAQLAVANSHQGAAANRISANALLASAVGLLITVGGIIVAVILARH